MNHEACSLCFHQIWSVINGTHLILTRVVENIILINISIYITAAREIIMASYFHKKSTFLPVSHLVIVYEPLQLVVSSWFETYHFLNTRENKSVTVVICVALFTSGFFSFRSKWDNYWFSTMWITVFLFSHNQITLSECH